MADFAAIFQVYNRLQRNATGTRENGDTKIPVDSLETAKGAGLRRDTETSTGDARARQESSALPTGCSDATRELREDVVLLSHFYAR
jgi:hypothetical protein